MEGEGHGIEHVLPVAHLPLAILGEEDAELG
jgi:hypothetical protein